MDSTVLNNPLGEYQDEPPLPGTSEKSKTQLEDLKPTIKGVENAKKRLRAFSIQKKTSISPIPLPKPVCTTVGSVGTVFIGKLASSKPPLKPGDIEEVADPKKPPKPPKPGTSKLQNADYLNIQKKTLSEIEAMKRKMELVDLGIPLGLICPAPNSDKAMPTKAMPPIKSMLLDPAKVDEIIREAKKAKAAGKSFKFSYEKLLPSYQNPFQKNKDKDRDRDVLPHSEDPRIGRDRRKYSDNFRRYSGKDEKRGRLWPKDSNERMRAHIIRERELKERKIKISREKAKILVKPKETDVKSKESDVKSKYSKSKVDTINLSDEDDDVQEVIEEVAEKDSKEADVNLKDFVVCDSWSENEDKKDPTPKTDKKEEKKVSKTTPLMKCVDPMEQLKQSLVKEVIEPPVATKVKKLLVKLQPVTDSFKFEIEDDNDDEETLDMFAETTTIVKKIGKKIIIPTVKKVLYDSPVAMRFDYDTSGDGMDDSFLESVIAEIKQDDMDDDTMQDKGLVEYDVSPKGERDSVTPEIDDRIREMYSSRSDCSDGFKSVESFKSTESGFKSIESGYKSTESGYKSSENRAKSTESNLKSTEANKLNESGYKSSESRSKSTESHKSTGSGHKTKETGSILWSSAPPRVGDGDMSKSTVASLETWSFVLKICQPLLFRHDRNKCYKETRGTPKVWFTENPKLCDCVKDRSLVYEELEMSKMELANSLYANNVVLEAEHLEARGWYTAAGACWTAEESPAAPPAPEAPAARACVSEWEAEDSQEPPTPPPHTRDEMVLDREYQKFMDAVWPDVDGAPKSETPRLTPVRETNKRPGDEQDLGKKKKIKLAESKMSSEGWSQESEVEEEVKKSKKLKVEKKRKRKHSPSLSDSDAESPSKKKKKALKKERKEKIKGKVTKRQRLSKKYLKKLKEKQLKKKKLAKLDVKSDAEEERVKQKKEKKLRKKKLLKQKKKNSKKKSKVSSSSSSSDSESERKSKKKNKKKKHRKRKKSTSDSNQSEELFDVNILKNIKTERLTDDEKIKNFPPNKKHREIINVKQLQNDFVSIQIKKEIEDVNSPDEFEECFTEEEKKEMEKQDKKVAAKGQEENMVEECIEVEKEVPVFGENVNPHEFKEPEYTRPLTPKPLPEESSQCSSQESIVSVKPYEKDDSHLRPSSQNSNYNFHDVMQNEGHGSELYQKPDMETDEDYEPGNYEMYEQMAMEYQSDVASQRVPPPDEQTSGRIETVVRARSRGEIKCDWRADPSAPSAPAPAPSAPTTPQRPSRWGEPAAGAEVTSANTTPTRPSRWGLKPSEVNIVLTGGEGEQSETYQIQNVVVPTVYKIQSLANRTENSNIGYDEAYMDMYGASDRLQYGDCFSREIPAMELDKIPLPHHCSSLDDRINLALMTTDLGDVTKDDSQEYEGPDRGILVTKSLVETRTVKRVTFADGYKPGQDSDTEDPPVRKRKKPRRTGCRWPCAATHGDHVSLWDALPPPPPPAGSPPPPARRAVPAHLLRSLRAPRRAPPALLPPHLPPKFDPNSLAGFMPPEPPPGLISF